MGIFSKTKEDNSKIFNEVGILGAKIARIDAEIEQLHQLIKQLRGVVNKKLRYEEENTTEKNKNSNAFTNYGNRGLFETS